MVVGELFEELDLVVIGAGPGGYTAAIRASQLGRNVTVIEKNKVGGVCLNEGCIPSKAIIHVADKYRSLKDFPNFGINILGQIKLDMPKLNMFKNKIVKRLGNGILSLLNSNNIQLVFGEAFFLTKDKIRVVTANSSYTYKFKDCIIATGSIPKELRELPFDGQNILSSSQLLELKEVPTSLIVVGGGYIGLELGVAFAKLGSKVTILEALDSILFGIDESLLDVIMTNLINLNIDVVTRVKILASDIKDDKVCLKVLDAKNLEREFWAEKCMVAVGREPNLATLGLENIGVAVDEKGFIKVDKQCRTNIANIFAIGDCTGKDLLAHKASYEGKIAAEVLVGKKSFIDYMTLPYIIFSDPEIAYTGLSKEQAEKQGYEVIIGKFPLTANGKALICSQGVGFVQVVADKHTKRILGVQMVGCDVSNLIAQATLAIEFGATVEDLALVVHAHPTISESLMEAAEASLGYGIHTLKR